MTGYRSHRFDPDRHDAGAFDGVVTTVLQQVQDGLAELLQVALDTRLGQQTTQLTGVPGSCRDTEFAGESGFGIDHRARLAQGGSSIKRSGRRTPNVPGCVTVRAAG